MPIKQGREYRNMTIRAAEAPAEGEDKRTVTGYATVFNTEYLLYSYGNYRVLEQIDRHAFDDCDMSDVIMQYNHEGRVFARNKNGTLRVAPDETGLKVEADLGGTEIGRQLYEEIRDGYTDKMSFGFVVGEDERTETNNHEDGTLTVHRKITKISKLYDVSAVSIPANDATSISARSYCEGVIAQLQAERQNAEERAKLALKIKIMEAKL